MRNFAMLMITAMIFGGCAGKISYYPPSDIAKINNSTTVDMPKNELWKRMISSLAGSFFVVNNLDKDWKNRLSPPEPLTRSITTKKKNKKRKKTNNNT